MPAVILVSNGVVADRLESLLKAAGWSPRLLSTGEGGGLETRQGCLHRIVAGRMEVLAPTLPGPALGGNPTRTGG